MDHQVTPLPPAPTDQEGQQEDFDLLWTLLADIEAGGTLIESWTPDQVEREFAKVFKLVKELEKAWVEVFLPVLQQFSETYSEIYSELLENKE